MYQEHAEGAARESVTIADLLRRGYEVFKGEGQTSFDIVAYKFDQPLRIQVKGTKKGGIPHTNGAPVASLRKELDCRRFDVLAVVEGTTIRYHRSIAHTHNAASYELTGPDTYHSKTTKKNINRAEKISGGKNENTSH